MAISIGDVKGWLGESSLDLGTLCQSSNIDANKLYKPIRNSSTTSLSNRDSDGISYTIWNSEGDARTAAVQGSSTAWLRGSYNKPRGSGYSEYYRLMDFDGYNTSACLSGDRYTRSGSLYLNNSTSKYDLTLSAGGFGRFQNQISSTYSSYSYRHYGFFEWSNYDSSWRSWHTNGNVTSTSIDTISLSYSVAPSDNHFRAGYTYYYMPFVAFTSSHLTNGDWQGWYGQGHVVNKCTLLPCPWISFTVPAQPTPPDPANFVEIYPQNIYGFVDVWNSSTYTAGGSVYVFNNSDYDLTNVNTSLQITTNSGTYGVGSFSWSTSTLSSHNGATGTIQQSSAAPGSTANVTYTARVSYRCPTIGGTTYYEKTATTVVTLSQ